MPVALAVERVQRWWFVPGGDDLDPTVAHAGREYDRTSVDDQHARDAAMEVARTHAWACTRCPALVASRSQVVVGAGSADADVLLVGSAPGPGEDAAGAPVVGQAGGELDRALGAVGLSRADVFVTTLAKCRPPGNRDPSPSEVANCSEHLVAQLELVRPVVVVALGAFTTKLLRGDPAPIRARRGRAEPRMLGAHPFWLLPVFDPAAALYAPELAEQLHADLGRLPELVARGRPRIAITARAPEPPGTGVAGPGQLELF